MGGRYGLEDSRPAGQMQRLYQAKGQNLNRLTQPRPYNLCIPIDRTLESLRVPGSGYRQIHARILPSRKGPAPGARPVDARAPEPQTRAMNRPAWTPRRCRWLVGDVHGRRRALRGHAGRRHEHDAARGAGGRGTRMSTDGDVFDSGAPEIYEVKTRAPGPAGRLPLTEELLRDSPSGDLFGLTQNAGMGWDPAEARSPAVPHPQHAGRPARRRRHADRARLSHRALGDRPAGPGRGGGAAPPAGHPVRRGLLRSVRRPHAGHDRHVRQPALSQRRRDRLPPAHPLAAAAAGRAGRRHLRQGPAGDDDGARRRCAICPACSCPAASRCRPTNGEDAGTVQTIGARFAHGTAHARGSRRARLPRLRLARAAAASSSARRRPRRWSPRRSACRCRTPRSRRPASRSGSTWRGARPARSSSWREAEAHRARHPHRRQPSATRWSCTPPSAARRICCCTFPPSPTRPGCRARRSRTGSPSTAACRASSSVLPNGPVPSPHRARLPRRRRAGGDAAPARLGLLDTSVLTVTGGRWARTSTGGRQSERRAPLPRAPARAGRRRCRTT